MEESGTETLTALALLHETLLWREGLLNLPRGQVLTFLLLNDIG